jgi:hypothetical protein
VTDFPEIVYRVPGLHREQNGGTFSYLGVNNQDELDAALADGWRLTLAEAIAGVEAQAVVAEVVEAQDAIDDISPATRDELEAKAKELGVSFNSRTSDKVLAQRIADAL